MKRAGESALVAFGIVAVAIACGDLEIGRYAAVAGGSNASNGGSAGAASGGVAGEVNVFGGSSGRAEITAGTGGNAIGASGAGGSPDGMGASSGESGAGGSPEPHPLEKPQYLKDWEPHSGAPSPSLTTLGYALPASDTRIGALYAGYDNGDVFLRITPDAEWRQVNAYSGPYFPPEDYSLPRLPVSVLRQSPADSKSLWVGFVTGAGRKIWSTSNGSQWWMQSAAGPLIDVLSISIDPFSLGHLLSLASVGGVAYVYESSDWGRNWQPASPGNPTFPAAPSLVSVVVADAERKRVWVGTNLGKLFVSDAAPGARTWVPVGSPSMPARAVSGITLSPTDANEVYVTFVGPLRQGLWVTRDGGQSFGSELAVSLPDASAATDAVYGVSVHPLFEDVLYLATSEGAFWSVDRGASFHR